MELEEQILLNEEEVSQLTEIDGNLLALKVRLADLEIQLSQANIEKDRLIEDFKKGRQLFLERVNYIANTHGLNINGPEKYGLDINQWCFRKV